MEHRSTARRSRRRRPPSRSSLLIGLVVVLLAAVPVLVPLLVTRDGGVPAVAAPGPATGAGVPGLPRAGDGADPAGTTASPRAAAPIPSAGTLAGTTAPAAPPTTTSAPRATRPGASPSSPAGAPSASTPLPGTLMAAPDLVVVAVGWSPEQPGAGEAVTFTAVVRNAGTDATPEVTHGVAFAVDGSPTTWSSAESLPLAPGDERTYTADGGPAGSTWTVVAGEHELRAYVDEANRIGETDDSNNVLTATLTVT